MLHQVGTSLLIYMMHGHTYIKFIMKFPSVNFTLIHQHICIRKRMPTDVITIYNLNLIVTLFNVLCLCDTLYFKGDEGKIKSDSINR